jgi:hypothetical protein
MSVNVKFPTNHETKKVSLAEDKGCPALGVESNSAG